MRRASNQISKLIWQNKLLTSLRKIKDAFYQGFKSFFQYNQGSTPFDLTNLGWCNLDEAFLAFLERPFIEEEILLVIRDCNTTKSPGPDGFNMG